MTLPIEPIAIVHNSRTIIEDDFWGGVVSEIVLNDALPEESLDGIEEFSHVEILFIFDRVPAEKIVAGARHPRGNPAWPRVGIFAQRGKNRPNRLAATIARVLGRSGRRLTVVGLDAVDGTPVVDIKPVLREFLPRETVVQPVWATELMAKYWDEAG